MKKNQSNKHLIVYKDNTCKFLEIISKWLIKIIGTTNEKQQDISEYLQAVHENNINFKDIELIVKYIDKNEFILSEGNRWDYLMTYFKNDKYVNFLRSIYSLTPCGLSTSPNAACGKGELFYRLLRPQSRQPSRGDIIDNSIKKELKGSEIRISSNNITGKQCRNITDKLFKEYINGNTPKDGGLKGNACFEIEKFQYKKHYESEFIKIPINKRLRII